LPTVSGYVADCSKLEAEDNLADPLGKALADPVVANIVVAILSEVAHNNAASELDNTEELLKRRFFLVMINPF
jgi:hypothetical protein